MKILISNTNLEPIYLQISNQIREMIIGGTLQEGQKLPSIRSLAKDLGISVTTSKRAYDELEAKGYLITFRGRGTFVGESNKDLIREAKLRELEEHLGKVLEIQGLLNLSDKELEEIYRILKEG